MLPVSGILHRRSPEGHDHIADILIDGAALFENDARHGREELVPEDMLSRAMESQVAEAEREQLVEPGQGVAAAIVSVVAESEPESTAEEALSEPVEAVIEELAAESVDEPVVELVEALVEEPVFVSIF